MIAGKVHDSGELVGYLAAWGACANRGRKAKIDYDDLRKAKDAVRLICTVDKDKRDDIEIYYILCDV